MKRNQSIGDMQRSGRATPGMAHLAVGLALAVGTAGCTDKPEGKPGTITVTASGVTSGQGKLLITEARAADGRQAAISCQPLTPGSFSSSAMLETIVGPTPCEDSSPIVLELGAYDLLTTVIMGGSMTPEQCARATVQVDGNVAVTMPALGPCT